MQGQGLDPYDADSIESKGNIFALKYHDSRGRQFGGRRVWMGMLPACYSSLQNKSVSVIDRSSVAFVNMITYEPLSKSVSHFVFRCHGMNIL